MAKNTVEKSLELIPSSDKPKDVGRAVFNVVSTIITDKINQGLHDKFLAHYKLAKNKHWKKILKKVPLIAANLLFLHRQRTSNMLTDNNPTFNVAKAGDVADEQEEIYLALERAAAYWWQEQEQQDVLESSVQNGETYGTAIEKVVFNPSLEYGLGEVETIVIDPYHFGFYPVKLKNPKDLQKAEAILHFWPMGVREAWRRWPKFRDKIKPDSEHLADLGDERREVSSGEVSSGGTLVRLAGIVSRLINIAKETKEEDDETLIVECWVKDYTMVKEQVEESREIENPDTGEIENIPQTIEKTAPKYKGHIRYIVICNGGDVVMEDRDNPNVNPDLSDEEAQKTYLYDKFPFTMVNSIKDTANAWGMSDFEQLAELNKEFDKAISQLVLIKDKVARAKIINPKTSGVPNKDFTNYPGIINPINAAEANGIKYLDFPVSGIDIEKMIEIFRNLFFSIAGTFELEKAQQAGRDVIAYKAIAALLEHAATMMRGKLRSYGRLIRERGRMFLSHVMNFYTEDRWVTYEEKGIKQGMKIKGSEMIIPAKLTVVSGSTMPISKVQQREEAIFLFEKQAIDLEHLHEKLDTSGRSEMLKRMKMGPLGELFERLGALGLPENILEAVQQIAQLDPKEFEKAIKAGELPSFNIPQQEGEEQGVTEQDLAAQQQEIDADKAAAEIKKTEAETELVKAKIETQKVEQRAKQASIEAEKEKLKIERVKAVEALRKPKAAKKAKKKEAKE